MNTKTLEQFEALETSALASVEGGKRPGGAPITGITKDHMVCLTAAWGTFYTGLLAPISLVGTVPSTLVACSGIS